MNRERLDSQPVSRRRHIRTRLALILTIGMAGATAILAGSHPEDNDDSTTGVHFTFDPNKRNGRELIPTLTPVAQAKPEVVTPLTRPAITATPTPRADATPISDLSRDGMSDEEIGSLLGDPAVDRSFDIASCLRSATQANRGTTGQSLSQQIISKLVNLVLPVSVAEASPQLDSKADVVACLKSQPLLRDFVLQHKKVDLNTITEADVAGDFTYTELPKAVADRGLMTLEEAKARFGPTISMTFKTTVPLKDKDGNIVNVEVITFGDATMLDDEGEVDRRRAKGEKMIFWTGESYKLVVKDEVPLEFRKDCVNFLLPIPAEAPTVTSTATSTATASATPSAVPPSQEQATATSTATSVVVEFTPTATPTSTATSPAEKTVTATSTATSVVVEFTPTATQPATATSTSTPRATTVPQTPVATLVPPTEVPPTGTPEPEDTRRPTNTPVSATETAVPATETPRATTVPQTPVVTLVPPTQVPPTDTPEPVDTRRPINTPEADTPVPTNTPRATTVPVQVATREPTSTSVPATAVPVIAPTSRPTVAPANTPRPTVAPGM